MIKLRRIGLERRRAFRDATTVDTKPDYANVASRYERILRDSRTPTRVASFYAVKFARFQAKVCFGALCSLHDVTIVFVKPDHQKLHIFSILNLPHNPFRQSALPARPGRKLLIPHAAL